MNRTKIPWCDFSWNPITGCLGGCGYCYARRMAHRFGQDFAPTFHEDRLGQPAKAKKPSKIFVCSTADLFGDGVPLEWARDVILAASRARQHTYQILTKRPERMVDWGGPVGTAPTVWLGATATDQASWDHACKHLSRIPSHIVRWISAEPVLGPIVPGKWLPDWVVVGPVTGCGSYDDRVTSAVLGCRLVTALEAARVPVFEKDAMPKRGGPEGWHWVREWPRVTP